MVRRSWTLAKLLETANDMDTDADTLRTVIRGIVESATHVEYGEVVLDEVLVAYALGCVLNPSK